MPASGERATIHVVSGSGTHKSNHSFEIGPIRPPSEAYSLLIRATRNCPWNRCLFCPVYKGSKFELRPLTDVIEDIKSARAISEGIKEVAWRSGYGGQVRETAGRIYDQPQYGQCARHVALWLLTGAKSAFLQDSNSLIMRTPDLVKTIVFLRETFPGLKRVTTYARSHTATRKPVSDLKEIREAGLDRIHIGLETGYDPLLTYMEKGCTARDHIEGGRRVVEAGISLCEYVMPGLGGRRMAREHALETARVLNEINPDHIRLRSLHVGPVMGLWSRLQAGDFELQAEDEVVGEIALLIENLDVTSKLKSDHTLNLLMEVQGTLPDDKERCLAITDRYLSLPDEERLNFMFGRRAGYYTHLSDLSDAGKHDRVDQIIRSLRARGDNAEEALLTLKSSFI